MSETTEKQRAAWMESDGEHLNARCVKMLLRDYAALEKLCQQQHEALEALTHGGSGVGRAKEWEDAETAITAYAALFPKTGGA